MFPIFHHPQAAKGAIAPQRVTAIFGLDLLSNGLPTAKHITSTFMDIAVVRPEHAEAVRVAKRIPAAIVRRLPKEAYVGRPGSFHLPPFPPPSHPTFVVLLIEQQQELHLW